MRSAHAETPVRSRKYEAAWPKAGAALRLKPAEVLFYSPEVKGDVEPEFADQ